MKTTILSSIHCFLPLLIVGFLFPGESCTKNGLPGPVPSRTTAYVPPYDDDGSSQLRCCTYNNYYYPTGSQLCIKNTRGGTPSYYVLSCEYRKYADAPAELRWFRRPGACDPRSFNQAQAYRRCQ